MQANNVLEWSERAILVYENLAEYLFQNWSERISLRVLTEIDHQISRVHKHPEQFPIFDDTKEIRRCVASSQTSIFFVLKPDKISLLSTFDNRLNPEKYRS